MVKYFKTRKGYFYKLKRNGKKQRISQDQYNQKIKTKKIRKLIGGGRTEQEIIDELKTKGKYDEWVSLGRRFGITSDTLRRPFKYYDVDGNLVNVSYVEDTYIPDVDNVAVFRQYFEKKPNLVFPTEYRIVNASDTLFTNGLLFCTGLAMIIGTKKFLAHLDTLTPVEPIVDVIMSTIETEGVKADTLYPKIYAGDGESSLTLQKAKKICLKVGIPEENYIIETVCMADEVSI